MDFIKANEDALGKKAIIEFQPMQAGDVKKTWADVGKLKDQTGYQPDCSVEEGINRFIKWYKNYYK